MEGKAVPGFRLQDGSGEEYTEADFIGSWMVVFFYSKDNTSG